MFIIIENSRRERFSAVRVCLRRPGDDLPVTIPQVLTTRQQGFGNWLGGTIMPVSLPH